ncbi:hypothetical protein DWB68_15660 [Galactobacter valiniphilus]|uniref:Uncharacterized protein n=1 Tax=Galactobacter valiniphilus TaxID=2676122 RepID=A0A399J631_9MICC|nr:hypothetical protein [Galactobacter valiniphilus]RII40871.1 hypothetical protein DWB68_15660 [Galactobacter valiniphilus]
MSEEPLNWDAKNQKIVSALLDAGEALIARHTFGPTRFWVSTDAYWTTFVDKRGHGYALFDLDGFDVFRPDKQRFASRAEALEACQLVALDHMHLSDADAKRLMARLRAEATKARKTSA